MRRLLFYLGLLSLTGVFSTNAQDGGSFQLNTVSAVVNDKTITKGDIEKEVGDYYRSLERDFSINPGNYQNSQDVLLERKLNAFNDVRENLIRRELILHEYRIRDIQIPEPIIQQRIRENMLKKFGDRINFIKSLRQQGITLEEHMKTEREKIVTAIMYSHHASPLNIIISPRQIEEYYLKNQQDYRLGMKVLFRMIVLEKAKHGGRKPTERLAQEILRILQTQKDFAGLAAIYSDHPTNKDGGLWEWKTRNGLTQELSEVAFSLSQGQLSGLIELPEAFYILKGEDISHDKIQSLAEVRPQIENMLRTIERRRREDRWVKKLEGKSHVDRF